MINFKSDFIFSFQNNKILYINQFELVIRLEYIEGYLCW